ncbi:hypothetical protein [Streptomyces sp. NRRL S-350]|uniref:hypothetical protein n=1 Tax=Streptomyces sp. NRRL S-350 TaxID=1463902 RepID=UPI0004BED5AE|nr:hypothetical protein [Streptomyces sp. NRRL S-350]
MTTAPVPLTRAALARRYGVDRSAITRALSQAATAHRNNPDSPPPPTPLNPGDPTELFDPEVFDAFWQARPRRGRPTS